MLEKIIYYCIVHSDGIKEYGHNSVPEGLITEEYRQNLSWNYPTSRNVIIYESEEQWRMAQNY